MKKCVPSIDGKKSSFAIEKDPDLGDVIADSIRLGEKMKRIIFPVFALLILLACNLGQPPATPAEIATNTPNAATEPAAVPVTYDDRLIAYYPLADTADDALGRNDPMRTDNAPFQADGGIFCNGLYVLEDPGACDVRTPSLAELNFSAFTVSAQFLIPESWGVRNPVFAGGQNYRWIVYELKPDGVIHLVTNGNQATDCTVKYQVGLWHEAAITYDGQTATLYLDGNAGCSVTTQLQTNDERVILLADYGGATVFRGFLRELKIYDSVVVPTPTTPIAADLAVPTDPNAAPVDIFLAKCPTEQDIASVDADLQIQFEADPTTSQPLACKAADGSRDLTPLQKRTYNILLLMRLINFTQPLPWTDKQLYTWLVDTIDGIRFRTGIPNSFCCEPANFINIQSDNLMANTISRWIEPAIGGGLKDLMILFVHEARHNEGKGHTCGANDNTLSEMGAWAVQYHLGIWLADNTADPAFFTAPDSDYFGAARQSAQEVRRLNFCQEPAP